MVSFVAILVLVGFLNQQAFASLKEEDERLSKLFMENVDPKRIEKYLT